MINWASFRDFITDIKFLNKIMLYWAPITSRIDLTLFTGAADIADAICEILNKTEGYSKKRKL